MKYKRIRPFHMGSQIKRARGNNLTQVKQNVKKLTCSLVSQQVNQETFYLSTLDSLALKAGAQPDVKGTQNAKKSWQNNKLQVHCLCRARSLIATIEQVQ